MTTEPMAPGEPGAGARSVLEDAARTVEAAWARDELLRALGGIPVESWFSYLAGHFYPYLADRPPEDVNEDAS